MRFFSTIIIGIFLLTGLASLLAINLPIPDNCGTSLALNSTIENPINHYLDERTGITIALETIPDNYLLSPDGMTLVTIRDSEVLLRSVNSRSETLFYEESPVSSVSWSGNSQAIIIQAFDDGGQVHIRSLNIETGNINFEHDFSRAIRWYSMRERDNPYLYAQFIIDPEEGRQGVMFMDTVTGEISRFTNPTSEPYVLSQSGRWVATNSQNGISIIDPQTGDYHPNFPMPIAGGNFQWQGDEVLWFVRRGVRNGVGLWRANIQDGTIDSVIENAHLKTLSDDGQQAYVRNRLTDETILINTQTGERHNLDIGGIATLQFNTPAFSPDGRCIAILITDFPDVEVHQLWIIDTATTEVHLRMLLSGDIRTLDWRNPGE